VDRHDRGLDRLRDGDMLPFGASEGLADEAVGGIREDAAGAKWITTPRGLFRVAPGETGATRIAAQRGCMRSSPTRAARCGSAGATATSARGATAS